MFSRCHSARPHSSLAGPTESPQHSEVMLLPGVVRVSARTLRHTPAMPAPCTPAHTCASSPSCAGIIPPVRAVLPPAAGAAERGRGNPTPTRIPSAATGRHRRPPHAAAPCTLSAFGAARTRVRVRICSTPTVGKGKGKKNPTDSAERGGGGKREKERENDRLQSPLSA